MGVLRGVGKTIVLSSCYVIKASPITFAYLSCVCVKVCFPPSLSMNKKKSWWNNPGFAGWTLSQNSTWQERFSGALLLYQNKSTAFRDNFLWYKEDPKGKINLMFLLHCFQLSGTTFMLSAPKRIRLTFSRNWGD